MLDITVRVRVSAPKNGFQRLRKAVDRFNLVPISPVRHALIRFASAGLIAAASHWALNDPGPSKLFAEELIKILLRTQ